MVSRSSNRLSPGATVELTVETIASDGDACAQHDGRPLRVAGLLPGERATVRVDHVGQHRVAASVLDVKTPSPLRRQAPCSHHGLCTGCPLMVATEVGQRELKRELLDREFGLSIDRFVADEQHELGYRWSSKRVVGGRRGSIVLGSYRRRSHELAVMEGCLVDHPDIAAAAREIEVQASGQGIVPFDEASGTGDLRYVWLKTDGRGGVLVTLITAADPSHAAQRLPERLERASGVAWSVQAAVGDAVRGAAPRHLCGAEALTLELCGQQVEIGPLGFLQPNPRVAALAYRDLVALPDGTDGMGPDGMRPDSAGPDDTGPDDAAQLAFDLYAGAGITTALLRKRFARVVPSESYPESAAALGIEPEPVNDFLARMVGIARTGGSAVPELVVANPPKAGLGEKVCRQLLELGAERVHLMSCKPATLARDLALLEERYRRVAVRAYDTLPQTAHVELVVWLERRG
jgi:23S rRNA (uracil1939-C5)-methyltransferase